MQRRNNDWSFHSDQYKIVNQDWYTGNVIGIQIYTCRSLLLRKHEVISLQESNKYEDEDIELDIEIRQEFENSGRKVHAQFGDLPVRISPIIIDMFKHVQIISYNIAVTARILSLFKCTQLICFAYRFSRGL